MKYLLIVVIVFISSCSICRFIKVSKKEYFDSTSITYERINPNCPKGSDVEGYNKQGYSFSVYAYKRTDSLRGNQYYFYLDSNLVRKINFFTNKIVSYNISYDSTYTEPLTNLEKHIFIRIITMADSLHLKNYNYLLDAKGFRFKGVRNFGK